jgi:hypothetical protein
MCLIIASPEGKLAPFEYFYNANEHNSDGWGVSWAVNGHLETRKGFEFQELSKLREQFAGKPHIVHFRYATSGLTDKKNLHPFEVSPTLRMAHNGILDVEEWDAKRSDTWHFVQILRKILGGPNAMNEALIEDAEYRRYIGEAIGIGNKLSFITSQGGVFLVNEAQGDWEKGIWYSNQYSTLPAYGYGSRYGYGWGDDYTFSPSRKGTSCGSGYTKHYGSNSVMQTGDMDTGGGSTVICKTCKETPISKFRLQEDPSTDECLLCIDTRAKHRVTRFGENPKDDYRMCYFCDVWDDHSVMRKLEDDVWICQYCDRNLADDDDKEETLSLAKYVASNKTVEKSGTPIYDAAYVRGLAIGVFQDTVSLKYAWESLTTREAQNMFLQFLYDPSVNSGDTMMADNFFEELFKIADGDTDGQSIICNFAISNYKTKTAATA